MTELYYNHPGEVREAMNFQCLHCLKIFTAPQGLDHHLMRVHKIDLRNFQYKKDWDVTTEIAADHTPIVGRKSSTITYSGDKAMKSKQEMTHNLECIVEGCGVVYSSSAGMSVHQQKAHQQGSKKDVNWRWTKKPTTINDLRSRAAQVRKGIRTTATTERPRTKRPYKKRQQVVPKPTSLILSPDTKYIEIDAVIRVPIEIGQPEILQQQQQS